MALTDPQLKSIADQLFLLRQPKPPKLPKPANTVGAQSLAARLDPVANDPKFKDLSIGVVDFTADTTNPRIWLHNDDVPWRIGSASKIAILLAAVQLRDDVRRVKALGIISTPSDFDQLFALPKLWKLSGSSALQKIAGQANAPRISTIFDVSAAVPDFIGAPNLDKDKLSDIGDAELDWPGVPDLTFWERLWLAGTQSDNVAATSCISEIGVDYMKAVQKAMGLFDPKKGRGMCMMLSQGFSGVDTSARVSRAAGAPKYRQLQHKEADFIVTDVFFDPVLHQNTRASGEPGSVAALTAYMIALMQDKLSSGKVACDTIRTHLADITGLNNTGARTTTSLVLEGVSQLGVPITKAHTKLGILGKLRSEFAYLEADGLKYAVLAAGIKPKSVGGTHFSEVSLGHKLGAAIHQALKAP